MNRIVQDPLQCPEPNPRHAGRPNNRYFRVPGLKFGEALLSSEHRTNDLIFPQNEPPVVRRGHVEEGSRAKRARPLAALPETVPTVEVTPSEVALPASLANHEFLVGSQKPPTSQVFFFSRVCVRVRVCLSHPLAHPIWQMAVCVRL